MNEQQVRDYVRKLSRFYTDALIYVVVNLGLILIWAISGGGYFWPIWVIIGWGIGLGVHAFSLGLIPQINAFVPFMSPEWEEKEIKRIMGTGKYKTQPTKKTTSGVAEKISAELTAIQKEVQNVVEKTKSTTGPKVVKFKKKKAKKTPKATRAVKPIKSVVAKKSPGRPKKSKA